MAVIWKGALPLALTVVVSACANSRTKMEPPPAWVDSCIDVSDVRVATALSNISLPSEPGALAAKLMLSLPPEERLAITTASAYAATELGHTPSVMDLTALRSISRRAFYEGFRRHNYCVLPRKDKFIVADFFIDALNAYLGNRGITSDNTFQVDGMPTVGREEQRELMSWLIIAAAQTPPNNSFKPKPLRGSA